MKKPTQQSRVLSLLEEVQKGTSGVPEEYLRRHPNGDGISARYFKQVLLISEVNGRISELRGTGVVIETSKEKDQHGFAYHRLAPLKASVKVNPKASLTMEEWFNQLPELQTN